jgi:ketosteroid isomerase-like protein
MPQTASPAVLERFREGFEWVNCGDLDTMQDEYAEDAELDMSAVFTGMKPYRGHTSMRRQWEAMLETWAGVRWDPVEVFDVGGGRYVVDLRLSGKGKRSGAEVDQRFGCLYTIRSTDNKVVRLQLFPTVQAAVDAAALDAAPESVRPTASS